MIKLLKLLGIGIVSGAACRMGSMLMDGLFPRGLGEIISRFKTRNEDQSEERNTYS